MKIFFTKYGGSKLCNPQEMVVLLLKWMIRRIFA